jgi:hypothetical protein
MPFQVIRVVNPDGTPTGEVLGNLNGKMFPLGAPLTSHDNVEFIDLPKAVVDNYQAKVLTDLSALKSFFGG